MAVTIRTDTLEGCLEVLGLEPDATPEDGKRAYQDLVQVWHPDRFGHNPRLQLQAQNKTKEINDAYSRLTDHWKAAPDALEELRRPRVLCVDDDPLMLKGMVRQLSSRFHVLLAADATEGLALLQGADEIAVVISDLVMPEVNGVAFLRQAMSVSPNTSRILLTGFKDTLELAVTLDRSLSQEILEKPCATATLIASVDRGVDEYRARSGRALQQRRS